MPSHHRARVFQTVILILFLGLSYLSFVLVHKIAQSRSEESFQVLADQILTSIDRRLEEYDRILDGVSGLVMASDVVTAADMEVYAKSLDIPGDMFVLDGIGLASAGSVDPGAGAGGPIVGGMNKRTATSSKPAEDQFIVQYVEPLASHEQLLGLDFASDSELLPVAERARAAGETIATVHFPGRSLQDRYAQILLLKPIYKSSQDRTVFLGFALAVLNIENAFKNLTPSQGKFLTLHVEAGADTLRGPLEITPASTAMTPDFAFHQSIEKFGQTFSLSMSSTPQFDAVQPFRARWVVLALGLFITALVSAIMHVLIRKNIAISADVTRKSRDLETQIQENRCILENAMLSIVSVTKTGQIIHCNEAALKLLVHLNGPDNMDGEMISDLLPDFDMQEGDGWSKVVIAPMAGGEPLTIEIEKKTWFTADGEERIALLMRDITVSERLTQEIAEAEQRWNLALMSAHIGVFDICLQTRTSVVSDVWRETLKIPALPGCNNPYQLQMAKIHPDDLAILKKAEDFCIKGHTERATARFRVNVEQDEWRWIESDAVVVKRAPDGTALRMLGIQTDVTERFKLEQMKREFVATVSHELRTPLTAVVGFATELQENLDIFERSDLKEFIGSVKWFFGIGPRPNYGRYTYWEKFDYFAVAWGVAIIGSTGLVLWWPEMFTYIVPGWAVNVATIIHSDEALLAVGFIFTIHFFNTHFRPDKFPMDPVIFSGRISVEELKFDKPGEYEAMLESGELENHLVKAFPDSKERGVRIFGFLALTFGLVLLSLIIYTMLFGYR